MLAAIDCDRPGNPRRLTRHVPRDKGVSMVQYGCRRRGVGTAALVALLAAGLTACASHSPSSTSSSKAPLVIGASVSLTGDFADSGKAVKNGYELWADTVNAKGGLLGRHVQVKIVDDTSSPTQVVTNYQNLINKD